MRPSRSRRLVGLAVAAVLPALAASVAGFGSTHLATFRADAVGWAACVAVAAFGPLGLPSFLVAVLFAPVTLGIAHAVATQALVPASQLAGICAGSALAVAGLRAVGRRVRCPEPAAGAVAALVLALAGSGVWWVDRVVEAVGPELRGSLRQAVVRADPVTAIAYDVAGHERLHAQDVYEGTVVATTPVVPPETLPIALAQAAVGLLSLGVAAGGRRRGVGVGLGEVAP